MADGDLLTVCVPPLRQDDEPVIVRMFEYTAFCGRRTFDSPPGNDHDDDEHRWSLIRANPSRYLLWLSQTEFSQTDAKHDASGRRVVGSPRTGFVPYQWKLSRLDSLRVAQGDALEITLLIEPVPGAFEFRFGRHRAYWLATNNAEFVPLMVPLHQAERFRERFEQG
ncbi:hypothetical protein ACV229_26605 [Burkholderia sp. MR1-5-21]